ncbi:MULTISPECIES: LppP/LprE family lipoprotein [Rhodococcus]|uniref:LppP/LprE family lipoprotein n=1 Tax=Rhodococcus cerastii TaxID=908616 RepID=A0ABU4CWS9_9NOCA|nr:MULTISPECIES: LppP/LprE family lipoprotein [Rhodococcus]MDV6301928.1 LppP/LprE family lipoprotein [Rhodococcus cerastii]MDV7988889.1 LppP/LprE family lipoprotein [Rhodococcus sp. IEGM 1374]MDV8057150.1 LppP/LprE family lipoprotein [Rhodococcus sp. IEGM 1343]
MKRLLLVIISAFALVACGNSNEPGAAPATTAPTTAPPASTQPQAAQPQPEASRPTVDTGAVEPDGPIDWNTEELPENNSLPDAEQHAPGSEYPICLGLDSTRVVDAVASLPDYFPGEPWIATQIGDQCADFTWVRTDAGGTASSPTHILFFAGHNYDYLGTATLEPTSFTSVIGQTADTVTVDYRWPVGDDAFANPTGGPVTIDYRWDGTQVTMIGTLPPEVTG